MLGNKGFQWFSDGPSVARFVVQAALPERKECTKAMQEKRKTMIVTGAGQGIGAGVTSALIGRGYNVVGSSLNITASTFAATDRLAVVRGDIGDPSTAREIASTAIETFGSIDGAINNAGVFITKPFLEYTAEDFEKLSGTNLQGYINISQLAVKQMLVQGSGGSVICVIPAPRLSILSRAIPGCGPFRARNCRR